jgi:hypothetical protein
VEDLADYDVLTLPGWHNALPEHWMSLWEAGFPNMRRVEQDEWNLPLYPDWAARLTEAVLACRRPVLLVGHSLGTSLATRWAHEGPAQRVAGAFLVAASDRDRFPEDPLDSFAPMVMKRLPFPAMVLASRNDRRVTFERAQAFATAWGAELADMGTLGHMDATSGLGAWPDGLARLRQFAASLGG